VVKEKSAIHFEDLFAILANKTRPPDKDLPQTGVGLDWERLLSPIFITSDVYGTRSSSIILLEKTGKVTFVEQTFDLKDTNPTNQQTRKFSFTISE
jgi:uncharacterized protein with NRDE domain